MNTSCTMPEHGRPDAVAACCRPQTTPAMTATLTIPRPASSPSWPVVHDLADRPRASLSSSEFWADRSAWSRAAKNTLVCLIGCSIGDFAVLFYLQIHHPETPMLIMMGLAMTAGILTSIALETLLLRFRERFAWPAAVRTAISMSLISMLGMELAANATDVMLTGGMADPATAWFWFALVLSLGVGFLAPLPYNYYKLVRHGRACH